MFRFKVNRTFIINTLTPLGGLEPPSFRLTAERASQLRHRGLERKALSTLDVLKSKRKILGFFFWFEQDNLIMVV